MLRQFLPALRRQWLRAACLALAACCVIYAAWRLGSLGMTYEWQWNRAWRHLGLYGSQGFVPGPLLKGAAMTVAIAVLGMLLAAALGLGAALLRLSPWPLCAGIARIYVSLWRNTPLLLQLFFAYFLISPLLDLAPMTTAIAALGAFEGAYVAEIVRSGILSVPHGQWEAALSLGFTPWQTLSQVIFPQAAANSWSAITNQAIATVKDTSLVSAIAVADLTMRSQAIIAETFLAFEIWLLAGAIYLLLALLIALPALWLERRRPWKKGVNA